MVRFILNKKTIETDVSPTVTLLDFIRYHQSLTGTKIGCREGDCGACTVLVGELINGRVKYQSVTSCIMPLGNAHQKHIVTIEGLNGENLSPVQQAMVDNAGTQCGFCTPGFVVSLTGHCLSDNSTAAINTVDGNICRCTGYKSIERASALITAQTAEKDLNDPVSWAVVHGFVPGYFSDIPQCLLQVTPENGLDMPEKARKIGGGTDLYVQLHDAILEQPVQLLNFNRDLKGIRLEGDQCIIGSMTTAAEMMDSSILQKIIPRLHDYFKLISSTQIRNMGTLAGNIVNASPIGDLTIFFLGLNASITLKSGKETRIVALKDFYLGYKQLDRQEEEVIYSLGFKVPEPGALFNFEKVSKRTYLDIASVNTSLSIRVSNGVITTVHAAAGGVAPIPKYLQVTCDFLTNRALNEETLISALEVLQSEIAPISDARGAEAYKRLLLKQLFLAHFYQLFPNVVESLLMA